MRNSVTIATVLSALLAAACVSPPAPPLEPDDFTLAGVPLYADSAEIHLTFGQPDSVDIAAENPFAVDVPYATWHYQGFEVRFSGDLAIGYMVHGGNESTLRGIRVGSAIDDVRRLYGEPTAEQPSRLTYIEQDADFGLRVVDFVVDGVVTRIYVGAATP